MAIAVTNGRADASGVGLRRVPRRPWQVICAIGLAVSTCGACRPGGAVSVDTVAKVAAGEPRGRDVVQGDLLPFCGYDGSIGLLDSRGVLLVSAQFGFVDREARNTPVAVCRGEKWGHIDKMGRLIAPLEFDGAGPFMCGLAPVKRGGKWGFINVKGELVIPCQYPWAGPFSETDSLAAVHMLGVGRKSRRGYINTAGDVVIRLDVKFHELRPFSEGLAYVAWSRMLLAGDDSLSYPEWVTVGQQGTAGYINKKGEMVIDLSALGAEARAYGGRERYEWMRDCREGRIVFRKNGRYGFLDKSGKPVIPPRYMFVTPFNEGLAAFSGDNRDPCTPVEADKGRWDGYIDRSGKVVIPKGFRSAWQFVNGLAAVTTIDHQRAYIDRTGAIQIKYRGPSGHAFNAAGVARVSTFDWSGYIDKAGRRVVVSHSVGVVAPDRPKAEDVRHSP